MRKYSVASTKDRSREFNIKERKRGGEGERERQREIEKVTRVYMF